MESRGSSPRAIRILVGGRVQGVGFRHHVRVAARQCGAVGYVRNLKDGDVEVWAEGSDEVLARLREAVRRGPRFSEVLRFTEAEERPTHSFDRFEIRF